MKVHKTRVKTTILGDLEKRRTIRTVSEKYNLHFETKPDDIVRLSIASLSRDASYWSFVCSNLFEHRADKLYLLLDSLIHEHKIFALFDLEDFRVQVTLNLASYLESIVPTSDNSGVYFALNFLQFEDASNQPPRQYGMFSPLISNGILNKENADLLQRKLLLGINPSIPDGECVQCNGSIEIPISWLIGCYITGKLHVGYNKIKLHKYKSEEKQDEDYSKYKSPNFLALIENHFSLSKKKGDTTNWRDYDKIYKCFLNIREEIMIERKTMGSITKKELLDYTNEKRLKRDTKMRNSRIKDIISACKCIPE